MQSISVESEVKVLLFVVQGFLWPLWICMFPCLSFSSLSLSLSFTHLYSIMTGRSLVWHHIWITFSMWKSLGQIFQRQTLTQSTEWFSISDICASGPIKFDGGRDDVIGHEEAGSKAMVGSWPWMRYRWGGNSWFLYNRFPQRQQRYSTLGGSPGCHKLYHSLLCIFEMILEATTALTILVVIVHQQFWDTSISLDVQSSSFITIETIFLQMGSMCLVKWH